MKQETYISTTHQARLRRFNEEMRKHPLPELVLQAWLHNLRSGRYEQAFADLRKMTPKGRSYCCLGVLVCSDDEFSAHFEWEPKKSKTPVEELTFYNSEGLLSEDTLKHFGLTDAAQSLLSQFNDCYNLSFPEIALLLEEAHQQEPDHE